MKTFHIIIISVASLVLIATSLLMYSQYGNKNPFFPPVSVNCPDYWKLNSNRKCVIPNDGTNIGNIKGNQIYEYQMINKQKVYSLLPKMYNKIKKKKNQEIHMMKI